MKVSLRAVSADGAQPVRSISRNAAGLTLRPRAGTHGRVRWPAARVCAICGLLALGAGGDLLSPAPRVSVLPAGVMPASLPLLGQPGGEGNAAEGEGLLLRVQDVLDFTVQNTAGSPGEPLALPINLPRNLPGTYTFMMFRGLPEGFTLSAGFRTKEHWVVSLRDAPNVKVIPAPGYEGLFPLEVLLVRGQDQPPERRIATVEFRSRAAAATPQTPALPLLDPSGQARPTAVESAGALSPPASRQMSAEDAAMMDRADRLLREGDIAAARLFYGRMAQKGLAVGAIAMAKTYDPEFLRTVPRAGLQPDVAKAREWYQKAQELGSAEAATRLSTLNAGAR